MAEVKFTLEATDVRRVRNSMRVIAACPYCGYKQFERRKRHFARCVNAECQKEFIVEGN